MPPSINSDFRTWINSNNTINLISDAYVVTITYEGITTFISLTDSDKKSIESLPTTCKEKIHAIIDNPAAGITSEPAVPGAKISLIEICRLIVAVQTAKYYTSIGRTMNATMMHYGNVLSIFNIKWDNYEDMNNTDDTNVPVINDKENDRKVIKMVSDFTDCISQIYRPIGPLVYVL